MFRNELKLDHVQFSICLRACPLYCAIRVSVLGSRVLESVSYKAPGQTLLRSSAWELNAQMKPYDVMTGATPDQAFGPVAVSSTSATCANGQLVFGRGRDVGFILHV